MPSEVAIIKNSNIHKAIREAVSQAGLPPVKGKKVLIKPNCNSPDPYPGTTSPEVVVEVVRLCEEAGAREIIVGDKSSVFWVESTEKVMKVIGLWDALKKTSAKILPFDEDEWVKVKPRNSSVTKHLGGGRGVDLLRGGAKDLQVRPASHWPRGFKIPKILTEAEVVISIPVIHTHSITGISLSLKNSVGVIDGWSRKKMHVTRHLQGKVAEINLAYEVDLVVLDGSKAFISGGPAHGEMVEPNTIVASPGRVQADIAAYKLLVEWGADLPMPPESHPQIAHAIKIGIK